MLLIIANRVRSPSTIIGYVPPFTKFAKYLEIYKQCSQKRLCAITTLFFIQCKR